MIQLVVDRLRSHTLLRNVGWLASAEMVSRVTRILAAICLARMLTPIEFGTAAVAITVFELVRVFNQNGIGAAVVAADEDDLPALMRTAHLAGWATCLVLTGVQVLVAGIVARSTGSGEVALMIVCLAGVYLVMPAGVPHGWMLQRQQRMSRLATVNAVQVSTDNILTAGLALTGFGPWAIVLPKLLTAPLWLIGVMWGRPWRPDRSAGFSSPRKLVVFAAPVLGSELLNAARLHVDKLIIGAVCGLELLGVYYFAFNAGLGLSSALSTAFNGAFYPNLCAAIRATGSAVAAFREGLRTVAAPLAGVFLLQAAAVPFYVPLVFGEEWSFAIPLIAVLCLSGPAKLLTDACALLLRASGLPRFEFLAVFASTAVCLGAILMGAQIGLFAAAIALALAATLIALALYPTVLTLNARSPHSRLERSQIHD
ncbi:oligosaccharide flippase family protein [Maricaulis sp.]|uniref:oligosaccharide flippase family protein n=1 Tax=Maricaulis sp. TaxID=1486257 RepID=UPI001AFE3672|nr:oligosaccharide flippase family protein [Maricaulis sp.]MBO6798552.1 oligosaccharide flippase family protein [Maricaulis sp.]